MRAAFKRLYDTPMLEALEYIIARHWVAPRLVGPVCGEDTTIDVMERLRPAISKLCERAAVGEITIYGRTSDNPNIIQPIGPDFWESNTVAVGFFLDDYPLFETHSTDENAQTVFTGLRVSAARLEKIWPKNRLRALMAWARKTFHVEQK